jgi:hypothetical protein
LNKAAHDASAWQGSDIVPACNGVLQSSDRALLSGAPTAMVGSGPISSHAH